MPPTPPHPSPARSAAAVNEEIRALVAGGRTLSDAERARYEVLLAEWEAAERGGVVEAA